MVSWGDHGATFKVNLLRYFSAVTIELGPGSHNRSRPGVSWISSPWTFPISDTHFIKAMCFFILSLICLLVSLWVQLTVTCVIEFQGGVILNVLL